MEDTVNATNLLYHQGIEDRVIKALGSGQNIGNNYVDAPITYTGSCAYAWKNMGPFKYNTENILNMSPPFPLFATYNADGIPPDASVKFSFNVDSNYPTNIVQFTKNSTSTNELLNRYDSSDFRCISEDAELKRTASVLLNRFKRIKWLVKI